MSDRIALLASLGALATEAQRRGDVHAVETLFSAIEAVAELHGIASKVERRQAADRERKRTHRDHSAESAESADTPSPLVPSPPLPAPNPSSPLNPLSPEDRRPATTAAFSGEDPAEQAFAERLETEDQRAAVTALLAVVPHRLPWVAVMSSALDGLDTPQLTPSQLAAAALDFRGNGAGDRPNLRHFRGYLRRSAQQLPEDVAVLRPNRDPFAAELLRLAGGRQESA